MTPEERQQLSQFAADNGLCITVDGDTIVGIDDNEPWPSREEVLGYPAPIDVTAFPVKHHKPPQHQLQPLRNERRRKASKAARKARKNRR